MPVIRPRYNRKNTARATKDGTSTSHESFGDNAYCSLCRAIDWKDVIRYPRWSTSGQYGPNWRLRQRLRVIEDSAQSLSSSKCKVCRMLSLILPPQVKRRDWNKLYLWASPLEDLYRSPSALGAFDILFAKESRRPLAHYLEGGAKDSFGRRTEEYSRRIGTHKSSGNSDSGCIVLKAMKQGAAKYRCIPHYGPCIALLEANHVSPRLPATVESFDWMQSVALDCFSCKERDFLEHDAASAVPGLRVIDCSLQPPHCSVVLAPEPCRYIALSYVWGSQQSEDSFPRVIRDAMSVTRLLGFQFLWVDKYCIPQNSQEKHRLIMSMDQIYAAAHLTIVAAAGVDANHGIPGISRPRKPQNEIEIAGCTMIDIPDVLQAAQESMWFKRAWTYQEAFLSKRLLIFTDVGASYHCGHLYIEERLQSLLPENFRVSGSPRSCVLFNSVESIISYKFGTEMKSNNSRFMQEIASYTKRDVSYPEDSIKAFEGVLQYFQTQPGPGHAGNLYGLPIKKSQPILSWYHPISSTSVTRRKDFPSWTWAGWGGAVEFARALEGIRTAQGPFAHGGDRFEPLRINTFEEEKHLGMRPERLSVTGPTIPFRTSTAARVQRVVVEKAIKSTFEVGAVTKAHGSGIRSAVFDCYDSTKEQPCSMSCKIFEDIVQDGDELLGLLLLGKTDHHTIPDTLPRSATICYGCVVLKKVAPYRDFIDTFERVGYIRFGLNVPGNDPHNFFCYENDATAPWFEPWEVRYEHKWLGSVQRKSIIIQ